MILGDPISYRNKVIYIKTELVELRIKGRIVIINFNILLLGRNKAVLEMPQLREYNLKINWIIGKINIKDI